MPIEEVTLETDEEEESPVATGGRKATANTLNDLSGEQWLYFTKSVLKTTYPAEFGHDLRRAHGANKPPRLCVSFIEYFTKAGARVLDPFAGVGGTLLACSLTGRDGVGIELLPGWVDIYHQVVKREGMTPQQMICGDALSVLPGLGPDHSFDFILTDPPYGRILKQTMSSKTARRENRKTDFAMQSVLPADLGNAASHEAFLEAMELVFSECYRLLKPGKYLVCMTRNNYLAGEYCFLSAQLAGRAKDAGFVPKGEVIWYQVGARLRPYGYPNAYIPNIVHHNIIVCQKPKK